MKMELVETPFRVQLFGRQGPFDITCVGASGMKLMDAMWAEIKAAGVKTKGVNHWVYLANGQMFVGVELAESGDEVRNLERIDVFLPRHIRLVHIGPYTELPAVWKALLAQIEQFGHQRSGPDLEIYGHWNNDPSLLETTIVIGLSAATS